MDTLERALNIDPRAILSADNVYTGTNTYNLPIVVPDAINNDEAVNLGQLDAVVGTITDFETALA